jgi:hypothetical protein
MKTVVVQNRFLNPVFDPLKEKVLDDCTQSVQTWCDKNNFDYIVNTDLSKFSNWPNLYGTDSRLRMYFWVLKYAAINLPYDRIVYLDTDVYIHGNPTLSDSAFVIAQYPENSYPDEIIHKNKLCAGLFWGNKAMMEQIQKWFYDQLYLKTRNIDLEVLRRSNFDNFYDEIILEKLFENIDLEPAYCTNHVWFGLQPILDNSFIHFGGHQKHFQYDMFRYVIAHESDQARKAFIENMIYWSYDHSRRSLHPYTTLKPRGKNGTRT